MIHNIHLGTPSQQHPCESSNPVQDEAATGQRATWSDLEMLGISWERDHFAAPKWIGTIEQELQKPSPFEV